MGREETVRAGKFELKVVGDHEIAYLKLPSYPKTRQVKASRSFRLFDCVGQYNGPDVVFDFDQDDVLVGIEVLAD